ncbi:MAG TPA: Flp family type IVb pilin [Candidatus Baltobacteraceae bacterium]|nr:Flp family type IVb pilin [Candidatus Baltobacteraceae bacterium]
MNTTLARLLRDDSGATMVEYAIMLSLIAAVCILVVAEIGTGTSNLFGSADSGWGG